MWSVAFQQNFDVDLKTYRRGEDTGIKNDWNVFFNITRYFYQNIHILLILPSKYNGLIVI